MFYALDKSCDKSSLACQCAQIRLRIPLCDAWHPIIVSTSHGILRQIRARLLHLPCTDSVRRWAIPSHLSTASPHGRQLSRDVHLLGIYLLLHNRKSTQQHRLSLILGRRQDKLAVVTPSEPVYHQRSPIRTPFRHARATLAKRQKASRSTGTTQGQLRIPSSSTSRVLPGEAQPRPSHPGNLP